MSPRTAVLCLVSSVVWIAVVLAGGCTSGVTPDCSGDAGCGSGFDGPPIDAGPDTADATDSEILDAIDEQMDAADAEEAIVDAPSDALVPCHQVFGEAATLECSYELFVGSCASGGFATGSCPSLNLTGCCVTTSDGGGMTTAECHYAGDQPDASVEQLACTTAGNTWSTTAP